jgi:hypothetical protein
MFNHCGKRVGDATVAVIVAIVSVATNVCVKGMRAVVDKTEIVFDVRNWADSIAVRVDKSYEAAKDSNVIHRVGDNLVRTSVDFIWTRRTV